MPWLFFYFWWACGRRRLLFLLLFPSEVRWVLEEQGSLFRILPFYLSMVWLAVCMDCTELVVPAFLSVIKLYFLSKNILIVANISVLLSSRNVCINRILCLWTRIPNLSFVRIVGSIRWNCLAGQLVESYDLCLFSNIRRLIRGFWLVKMKIISFEICSWQYTE